MWENLLTELIEKHRGKVLGIMLGLVASIIFITYGFWKALFIIACLFVGYFIGKKIDEEKNFDKWIGKVFKNDK